MVAKSAAKKPKNEYKEKLDSMIDDGADWFMHQDTEKIIIEKKHRQSLYADLIRPDKPSNVYIICIHGYTSSPANMGIYAKNTMNWVIMSYCLAFADTEIRSRIS